MAESGGNMAESGRKPKKTTDDIMDVSYDLTKFLAEHGEVRESLADSGFGRMSETGRVHVNSEGKVVISGREAENATDENIKEEES